ncbi:hypothetical protein AAF712_001757 [Marasmius tenuissimus]|uniref:Zn(2)-C6 fungal-type domain-containing protein n=1 Tax=Marasmius tenuissimus TaxID=585030 RepID=A0ABR3AB42_9AGAR
MIRRRSSKACDQCRKSKCKCERTSNGEPCRNCVMLGTSCTFLGPSRKRGPPKGYIDAIEARLHQTEALLGIMLSCEDDRAKTLLRDISQDPLAKDIINRVDNSSYGVKGRERDNSRVANGTKGRHAQTKEHNESNELASTHPSNEWQDGVTAMLRNMARARVKDNKMDTPRNPILEVSDSELEGRHTRPSIMTSLPRERPSTATTDDSESSPTRRQRRRIRESYADDLDGAQRADSMSSTSVSVNSPIGRPLSSRSSASPGRSIGLSRSPFASDLSARQPHDLNVRNAGSGSATRPISLRSNVAENVSDDEEEIPSAIGQLSLNEDEQVRYHGKASGLYILDTNERVDGRNAGGIWRFPKARIWPPMSRSPLSGDSADASPISQLPSPYVQEKLLNLYFAHAHPVLPVVHKRVFFDNLRAFSSSSSPSGLLSPQLTPATSTSDFSPTNPSPYNSRRRRVPALLLFAMFAVAARHSDPPDRLSPSTKQTEAHPMWDAGDDYFEQAQRLLEHSYVNSQPETCQALLLMGYREIGIGAMGEAWTYVGMAIRMAQDLGMHRRADGWTRAVLGGRIFGDRELQERRRIWFSCVVMDKYVSSYIGRPLMIFERDFDTLLPSEADPEEDEPCPPPRDDDMEHRGPGKIISCFNASATLSGIVSMVIQAIYAVRPVCSRHGESVFLEGILDKWLYELPEHLRYEPPSSKVVPSPHVLTLHMQYWCAVLLLHRPFMRMTSTGNKTNEDDDLRAATKRHYELSTGAANRITSIASLYIDNYSPRSCSAFICYYLFTASLMHVTALSMFPNDPQAGHGLNRCMELLHAIEIVWPSAGRAVELLKGTKINRLDSEERVPGSSHEPLDSRKRPYSKTIIDERSQSGARASYTSHSPVKDDDYSPNANSQYGHNSEPPRGSIPSQSPQNSAYYRADHRWTPEHHFDQMDYAGSLTTSAMPQSYSTGMVNDRSMHGQHRSSPHPSMHHQTDSSSIEIRYPSQYWGNYNNAAYPQPINAQTAYDQVPHQSQNSSVQSHPSSQMFLPQPYINYDNSV